MERNLLQEVQFYMIFSLESTQKTNNSYLAKLQYLQYQSPPNLTPNTYQISSMHTALQNAFPMSMGGIHCLTFQLQVAAFQLSRLIQHALGFCNCGGIKLGTFHHSGHLMCCFGQLKRFLATGCIHYCLSVCNCRQATSTTFQESCQ